MVAITGIDASKASAPVDEEKTWSIDELKAGKPMMVYYFVPNPADPKAKVDCGEANYNFARKAEFSAFQRDQTVERLNKTWVPKKVELARDADQKEAKNQARIEFWSFMGKKIDVITAKNSQALNPSDFETRLKDLEKKNREICNAEIKRINDEIARRAKEETAAK